jgi:hypothetical protein
MTAVPTAAEAGPVGAFDALPSYADELGGPFGRARSSTGSSGEVAPFPPVLFAHAAGAESAGSGATSAAMLAAGTALGAAKPVGAGAAGADGCVAAMAGGAPPPGAAASVAPAGSVYGGGVRTHASRSSRAPSHGFAISS